MKICYFIRCNTHRCKMFLVLALFMLIQFCIAMIKQATLQPVSYGILENIQFGATATSQAQYPWIGEVIHSRFNDIPHVCTAVCIDKAIFITAARCIYSLKIKYTTIRYMNRRLRTIAFVVPSTAKATAGMFDDIGFIVVNGTSYKGKWITVELMNLTNRTDGIFGDWFYTYFTTSDNTYAYKAIGFAKAQVSPASPSQVLTPYQLMEINVNIDMDFTTVTYHKLQLPCYHACNYQERLYELEKCSQYLGVEGAAVYDAKSKKLLGVATWAPWSMSPVNSNNWKLNRIVGFSVANSPNFFEDWGCARRIRDEKTTDITTGHYQRMCDKL